MYEVHQLKKITNILYIVPVKTLCFLILETLHMKIRIAGHGIPSANAIKIGDFGNGDLCMKSVEEGSILIGLEVLPSALKSVGYFLGLIDDLVYSLLNKRTAAVNNTKHVIISMDFIDFNYG